MNLFGMHIGKALPPLIPTLKEALVPAPFRMPTTK